VIAYIFRVENGTVLKDWPTHSGEKLFDCETCSAKFESRFDLRNHVQDDHGEKVQYLKSSKVADLFVLAMLDRFFAKGELRRGIKWPNKTS